MREANPNDRTKDDRRPVVGRELPVRRRVTDRYLHPAVVDHDPEGGERRAECHHRRREQVEPRWHPRAAKQQDPEEACFEEERGKCLVRQQHTLDWPYLAGKHAPVGAVELTGVVIGNRWHLLLPLTELHAS